MKFVLLFLLLFPHIVFANDYYDYDKSIYNDYLNVHEPDWLYGVSMAHLGFIDGEYRDLYTNRGCKIGDVCAFDCISDKCKHESLYKTLAKTRYNSNGLFYWFVGRPDKYPCPDGDGICHSFDSPHDYGWLQYGVDFVEVGVIAS